MSQSFWKKSAIQQFVLRFLIIFTLVETFLYYFPPLFYQEWLAAQTAQLLNLEWKGISILVHGSVFTITSFCTGLTTWGVWLGLVGGFSLPAWNEKIRLAILGLGGVLILNTIRIIGIVYAGKLWGVGAADALHTLTWFILSLLVLGTWITVMKKKLRASTTNQLAQKLLRS